MEKTQKKKKYIYIYIHIVHFSCSVMSDSFHPHALQHARPARPSPAPGVYSNSCPLSQGCHPTIASSVIPFSSRLQSFPASGSFPMSQFFTSGGQSFSFSISPSHEYSQLIFFGMDRLDLLAVQETLRSLLQHHGYTSHMHICVKNTIYTVSPNHFAAHLKITEL